ncbi:hypothetical protein K7432_007299 [Basidiobolus ranarum]|uniref:Polyketide synthase n=1 Tax=Basidiobolus ranarum TaxID=34480 RepID=A0ABR2WTW8_9FUNG
MATYENEPIAVVGLGLRLPGDAESSEELWELLVNQHDCLRDLENRFGASAYYHPDPNHKGTISFRKAHLLDNDPGTFDAKFFSINPREAKSMDPQQRLLLEVIYEAAENAGITLEMLSGSNTGVYTAFSGYLNCDYYTMVKRDLRSMPSYIGTGNYSSIVSNRASYVYNLKGPSISVDTACYSSLVALDIACKAIRSGDIEMAIVGGTSLILDFEACMVLSSLQLVSATSRCHTFSSLADGYSRGEGICCMVLKPLSAALRDNDTIRALIRGTGSNQDGHTDGMMLPSSEAQEELIRKVYSREGIDPMDTQYVEAHGTGTTMGDSIEMATIARVFGRENEPKSLYVGSIKSNIGHLEGASGIAGVIKTIVSLERGKIPPLYNSKEPVNPLLEMDKYGINLAPEVIDWPDCSNENQPKRASVNSFGVGGTNAHAILEEYRANDSFKERDTNRFYAIVLSAGSEHSAKASMENYYNYLKEIEGIQVSDLAYTLANRRSLLPFRHIAVVKSLEELVSIYSNYTNVLWKDVVAEEPKVAFVFTGQGAQWCRMGCDLISQFPLVKRTMEACEEALNRLVDKPQWSLLEELHKPEEESLIGQSFISQPLCTALQIALIHLWKSWGVRPVAVIGHSSGEIAAAYCSGIVSLEEAMANAYYRGAFKPTQSGKMMAVELSPEQCQQYNMKDVSIAAINSSESLTLSGDETAIRALYEQITQDGYYAKILHTDCAYHSCHMLSVAKSYRDALASLKQTAKGPSIPMMSTVHREFIHRAEITEDYWVKNMVNPVQFKDALTRLDTSLKPDIYIDIGPHSALKSYVTQISPTTKYLSSLRRMESGSKHMLEAAGSLLLANYKVNIAAMNGFETQENGVTQYSHGKCLSNLPKYAWDHTTKFWYESRVTKNILYPAFAGHELLGLPNREADDKFYQWRNYLRISEIPWLLDHQIQGSVVFPAAGYIVMAIEAIHQIFKEQLEGQERKFACLKDVCIKSALTLQDMDEIEIIFTMHALRKETKSYSEQWFQFEISTFQNSSSEEHCCGLISLESDLEIQSLSPPRMEVTTKLDPEELYSAVNNMGLYLGPTFRRFEDILCNGPLASMQLQNSVVPSKALEGDSQRYIIHPCVLDSIFKSTFPALITSEKSDGIYVPTRCKNITIDLQINSASNIHICTQMSSFGRRKMSANLQLFADREDVESPLLYAEGVEYTKLDNILPDGNQSQGPPVIHRVVYEPDMDKLNPDQAASYFSSYLPETQQIDALMDQVFLCYIQLALMDLLPNSIPEMPDHLRHLWAWMQQFRLGPEADRQKLTDDLNRLSQEMISREPGMQIVLAIGCNLVDILRSNKDPLTLMTENGLLEKFYRAIDKRFSIPLGKIMATLAHKYPYMNVLEIGAGTGGATRNALLGLESLGNVNCIQSYTFTDISKGFFENAKEKFEKYSNFMSYKALNIEQDPIQQGFREGYYDLIIASNVLHATESISKTLQNTRKLLRPGGYLLLSEVTRPWSTITMIMGTLPGWWFGINDNRTMGPLLSEEQWCQALRQNGFSGITTCIRDSPNPEDKGLSILIERAVDPQEASVAPWKFYQNHGFPPIDKSSKLWIYLPDSEAPEIEDIARSIQESISSSLGFSSVEILPLLQSSTRSDKGCDSKHDYAIILSELKSEILFNCHSETLLVL